MSEATFIKDIQESMPKEAWYELIWYLLHHNDVDLRTAYKLYQDDDARYNKWLRENNINKIDPGKSTEEVLLKFVTDAIEVADTEGDVSVQEYFKEKTLKSELEQRQALQQADFLKRQEEYQKQQAQAEAEEKEKIGPFRQAEERVKDRNS